MQRYTTNIVECKYEQTQVKLNAEEIKSFLE